MTFVALQGIPDCRHCKFKHLEKSRGRLRLQGPKQDNDLRSFPKNIVNMEQEK